ncbi:MAG: hypothetical protein LUD50_04525, partial [Clostridia bacterium]|nr:hypothetical protein [Clostridia bacterium]
VYGLCQFVNTSYLYLSSNFFGGVSIEAILGMNRSYLFVVLGIVVVMVLSIVAVFMGTEKKSKAAKAKAGSAAGK